MATDTALQTQAILAHHLQSLGAGLLDAILSDYTEDSILFTPNGLVCGLDGLRAFFGASIKNTPPELMQALQMIRQDVDGEIAYVLWKAEPYVSVGADTFVVRNSKIMVQTFAAYPLS
jgi:ketosteroid isomerase-like protein